MVCMPDTGFLPGETNEYNNEWQTGMRARSCKSHSSKGHHQVRSLQSNASAVLVFERKYSKRTHRGSHGSHAVSKAKAYLSSGAPPELAAGLLHSNEQSQEAAPGPQLLGVLELHVQQLAAVV